MARVHIRFRYLCNLWQQVAQETSPPQFDRWLVTYFKTLPQLGRRDRLWYGNMGFACMRYATYVAQRIRHTPMRPESYAVVLERALRDRERRAASSVEPAQGR